MSGESGLCCPVCKARFRSAAQCSRCGGDLTVLMLLAAHAYALRQSARQALRSGDAETALASARAAQGLHSTPEGGLLQFASALATGTKQARAESGTEVQTMRI
jgi:hypothetical protein